MQPHKVSQIPAENIHQLNLGGLNGRYVHIANKRKKRELLLVYGHHASLERYYGFADDLAQYGSVTMPDLPGFGGMDSLYKIGQEASIDELADYLAAFVKFKYKRRPLTIAGFSIGSAIVTRMLQKYPDIAKQVNLLISVAGFTSWGDFKFTPKRLKKYRLLSACMDGTARAWIFRRLALNRMVLLLAYRHTTNAKPKFVDADKEDFKTMIRFEVELWHANDTRTHIKTSREMIHLDLTGQKVELPIHHISLGGADQYFDNRSVVKNMRRIFTACTVHKAKMKQHMPSVIADKEAIRPFVPQSVRRLLTRAPK